MQKITVEIEWNWPDEPHWLNADNIALALHAHCENTQFKVHETKTAKLFFHPLGLALAVDVDRETGKVIGLHGIWDYRDDPEGIIFNEGMIDKEKIEKVSKVKSEKAEARIKKLGYEIQEK